MRGDWVSALPALVHRPARGFAWRSRQAHSFSSAVRDRKSTIPALVHLPRFAPERRRSGPEPFPGRQPLSIDRWPQPSVARQAPGSFQTPRWVLAMGRARRA